jgi:hypothetical protein
MAPEIFYSLLAGATLTGCWLGLRIGMVLGAAFGKLLDNSYAVGLQCASSCNVRSCHHKCCRSAPRIPNPFPMPWQQINLVLPVLDAGMLTVLLQRTTSNEIHCSNRQLPMRDATF